MFSRSGHSESTSTAPAPTRRSDAQDVARATTHDHPDTFKAAQFTHKNGRLEIKDVKWRDPKAGEVVIKVKACGVSMFDIVTREKMAPGVTYPRTPGEEFVGVVCCVAPGEKMWKEGDCVGGTWHGGHCNMCTPCRAGDFVCCERESINGVTRDGGMAEYCIVRSEAVVGVPKHCDPACTTAFMSQGSTFFNALKDVHAEAGDLVAIHGAGGLGCLARDMACAMGFRTVMLGEHESMKQELNLGQDEWINISAVDAGHELQRMGGAKVVMCTLPAAKHMPNYFKGLQPGGKILVLTPDAREKSIDIPLVEVIMRRLTLTGWPAPTPLEVEECLEFVKARKHDFNVKTRKFPLDKANETWDMLKDQKSVEKPVIFFE